VRQRFAPKRIHAPSLDWLNFFVADVRGGLGPFVTVFLVGTQKWNPATVGLVTTLGGWAGLVAQAPIGAWIDQTKHKRGLLLAALIGLSAGAVVFIVAPAFWPVLFANGFMQVVSGVFDPTIAAITVGLFARDMLTRRMGRNAAWSRAGNLVVAAMSGFVAWLLPPSAVFLQVPIISALTAVAVMSIPYGEINQRRARGLRQGSRDHQEGPAEWLALFRSRPLLVFGVCSFLYELADAPLLTLVGQEIGVARPEWGLIATSALVIAAQAGMMLTSILVGHRADSWGQRWLLTVGFAMLPVQAALTLVSRGPGWLIAVQFFGGLGTGLFAALTPLWLVDATQGTGRYNVSQGAMATVRALGATSSGFASEVLMDRFGYDAAYIGCGIVSVAALALLWLNLPDVSPSEDHSG
jgi:MFS family permease